jgi:hypothetical protein
MVFFILFRTCRVVDRMIFNMLAAKPFLTRNRLVISAVISWPRALIFLLIVTALKVARRPIVSVYFKLDIVRIHTDYLAWNHHLGRILTWDHHLVRVLHSRLAWLLHHRELSRHLLHHGLTILVIHWWWHHRLSRLLHHWLSGHLFGHHKLLLLWHHYLILHAFNLFLVHGCFRFFCAFSNRCGNLILHFNLNRWVNGQSTTYAGCSILFIFCLAISALHL